MITFAFFPNKIPDPKPTYITNVLLQYANVPEFLKNTPVYRFLKKNMMTSLRLHRDGIAHLEDMTIKHTKELLDKMESEGKEAFDLSPMIGTMMGNVCFTIKINVVLH